VTLTGRREARLLFCLQDETIVGLHAFIKKTPKTPRGELETALRRKWMMENG
jgi:phage-related protein